MCVENRSSYEARDLRRKFAINCRGRLGFLFTLQKIAVSDPARGSNPTFLLGQKRRVRELTNIVKIKAINFLCYGNRKQIHRNLVENRKQDFHKAKNVEYQQ